MLKKTLATLLALALLIGCLPALAAGDGQPFCFVPDELVAAFNNMIDYTLENVGGGMTASEKDELARFMRLAFTESEGDNAYYDNADQSICLSARLGDSAEAPAECLWLTLEAVNLDETRMRLAQVALATAICSLAPAVDFDALYAWITESREAGARFDMEGWHLELTYAEDSWIYELAPEAAGIALDDGDALKSLLSDYLESGKADDAEPTPEPEPTPAPNPDLLVDWKGFSAELLRVEPYVYSSLDKVQLNLYCRYINNSDIELNMDVTDVKVNGVPVKGMLAGVGLAPGLDSEECFWLEPDHFNKEAGYEALCNPEEITMTVELEENGRYQTLYSGEVTVNLTDEHFITPEPTATPTPTVRPTPTATPSDGRTGLEKLRDLVASRDLYTLCKGDRGEAVSNMQSKLIKLGYLLGEADGAFGSKTADAVRLFNEANGFGSTEIASIEMQKCLYGSDPVPYEEPWVPLIFNSSCRTYWKKYSGNKLGVNVQVVNSSRTHTIKAFELYMYAEDVYGERIYGETTYYYGTTTKKVKPGQTVTSDYIVMPNRSEVYTVYIAINKVVFDDGTVRECDEPDYWYWTTPWK